MNCRRINSLLSAYLDGELSGREMGDVRAHLDTCRSCQNEHETLWATKRMVASLALKVPREELENLLIAQGRRHEAARTESPYYVRMAAWLLGTHPITLQTSGGAMKTSVPFLRPGPLAATALLSLAGFWAASASLDSSGFREGAIADTGNWYAPGAAPSIAYGGEVPSAASPAPVSSGYLAASSVPLRPAAALLAAWLPSRSENAGEQASVSLPLVTSGSDAPSSWGARAQKGPPYSPSASAFLPASAAGGGNGFVPVSLTRVAWH